MADLNPEQIEFMDVQMLMRGLWMSALDEFERCYSAAEYQELLDFLNRHAPALIERMQKLEGQPRRFRRRHRIRRNPPKPESVN